MRDVAGLLLVGILLYGTLITATGQFFHGPPVVVVESGSMMHCANGLDLGHGGTSCGPERYGRVGTIDPGDLIFVRDVDGRGDVRAFAGGGERRYGGAGDTVIYQANGDGGRTPIIHRAMFWLEVNGDGTFSIPELGVARATSLSVEGLGLDRNEYRLGAGCTEVATAHALRAGDSGFITKGDNNPCFDQARPGQGFGYLPVQPEWVVGKARGEVPWIGLLKLKVFDILQGTSNYQNAPGDLRTLMWVSLGVLVGGPLVAEALVKRRNAAPEDEDGEAEPAPTPSADDGPDRPGGPT